MQAEGTVFIIDPDPVLRESLQSFLKAMSIPSAGYASAEEFLQHWDDSQPGCLLSELFLGGMSGIDLQKKINGGSERLPFIFISEFADVPTAVQAIQAGAVGFLTKPFSKQTLLENLREALKRNRQQRRKQTAATSARQKIEALTRRESQLLEYVVKGLKNREIAENLDLSLKTVEMHRSRMMKKMRVDSVADLIRIYLLAYPQTVENAEFFIRDLSSGE